MKPLSPLQMARSGMCIGCGACAEDRPMALDQDGQMKPTGGWTRAKSERLARVCPFSPTSRNEDEIAAAEFPGAPHRGEIGRMAGAWVGHVAEGEYRERGSSGGMVSWAAAELLRRGIVDAVAHVVPGGGGRLFGYRISRSADEIAAGARSRYYPVEMSSILEEIRTIPGRYAIVGVPCFIKAVHLLRREEAVLKERIVFTLGLFCGHMKSARMLESFAWQMGTSIAEITRAEYRIKDPTRPASVYVAELQLEGGETRRREWSQMPDGDWGAGFFMNPACDWCDDVIAETADLSFGDAWLEPYTSDGRGTNVVVARSPLAVSIVEEGIAGGDLTMEAVDAEFVRETQAAGFRHRREGLAYRLTWRKRGLRPEKRVAPSRDLASRRKMVYRMRRFVSRGSSRVFRWARIIRRPRLYIRWAEFARDLYWGVAYGRSRIGRWVERFRPEE